MPVKLGSELKTLDVGYINGPFVDVVAKDGMSVEGLNLGYVDGPVYAVGDPEAAPPAPSPAPRHVTITSYDQTTPADTWTIEHGMNTYPVVDVVIVENGARQKMLPASVQYIDANTVQITFSQARVGTAVLAGRFSFIHNLEMSGDTTP